MPPIDSADVLCHASVDTLCALVFATGTVRHRARSSRLAPAIRAVSPNVLRLESLSYARAARDWTRLAPDAVFRTDRKSTRLNSSHLVISYAVFCLKKK